MSLLCRAYMVFPVVVALFAACVASADDTPMLSGQSIAFETARGNCLACHRIAGGTQMGDIGPELKNMRARFPDPAQLYQQIWDAGQFNIHTLMPPYGRHGILTDAEIEAVIAFLYTK